MLLDINLILSLYVMVNDELALNIRLNIQNGVYDKIWYKMT